jgi:hypothetical protein
VNRLPLLTLLATALACGGSDSLPVAMTVRDSAGVRVVENRGAAAPLTWQIGTFPLIEIGGEDAAPEHQLFRVVRALRLASGGLVVANAGSHELRFYDVEGRFERAVGGEGEGPGEFRSLDGVFPYRGDSLLAVDDGLRRLSVFAPGGGFGRSFNIVTTVDMPFVRIIGAFDDLTLLGRGGVRPNATPSGLQRYHPPLFHLDTAAILLEPLGPFPGGENFFVTLPGGAFGVSEALFGRSAHIGAAGARFYVAANDAYQIARHRPNGELDALVRWLTPARRVTDADVARERARRLSRARSEAGRAQIAERFDEQPRPASFPAYGPVVVDDASHLWVGDYTPDGIATTWTIFDPEGRLLGAVPNPPGFAPDHIGQGFLLGHWRDDLDVEYVRLYPLARGTP